MSVCVCVWRGQENSVQVQVLILVLLGCVRDWAGLNVWQVCLQGLQVQKAIWSHQFKFSWATVCLSVCMSVWVWVKHIPSVLYDSQTNASHRSAESPSHVCETPGCFPLPSAHINLVILVTVWIPIKCVMTKHCYLSKTLHNKKMLKFNSKIRKKQHKRKTTAISFYLKGNCQHSLIKHSLYEFE